MRRFDSPPLMVDTTKLKAELEEEWAAVVSRTGAGNESNENERPRVASTAECHGEEQQ